MLRLRPARADELPAVTELCLRSKAVWGYDAAFIAACRTELTVTPDDLRGSCCMVAEQDGEAVGFAQVSVAGDTAVLDKLFIEPACLRSGIGRRLWVWAVETAGRLGARRLLIDADPDAADFYRRMGARPAGTVPSGSIPGRRLPRLALDL